MFWRVNVERLARGHGRLRWDRRLAAIAHDRAIRAASLRDHPAGLAGAMSGQWEGAGEALAWGPARDTDPLGLVRLWIASPTHRPIVLRSSWTHAGVGVYRDSETVTISLVVADRRLG